MAITRVSALLFLVGLSGVAAVMLWPGLHDGSVSLALSRLNETGGVLLFLAAFIVIVVAGILPASLAGASAGALWGIGPGFALSTGATLAGAAIAFWLTRSLARPSMEQRLSNRPRLAEVDKLLARDGWKLVLLLRVSPVMPFAPTSYALGLTSIGFRDYMIGTLASLPALLGYVATGAFAGEIGRAASDEVAYLRLAWLGMGVMATLLATVHVGRLVRRALAAVEPDAEVAADILMHTSLQDRHSMAKTDEKFTSFSASALVRRVLSHPAAVWWRIRPGRNERVIWLIVFLLLVLARLPNVALHGRVWAEEAIFLGNALLLPWWQALFHSYGGYLNIVANMAGLLAAHAVPLEEVRWVGVVTGLAFQGLTGALLLSSSVDWLRRRWQIAAALSLLATAHLMQEVWLNSLHPQFHLTLCAALILAMPARGRWMGAFHLAILALGALSGPTTWFLTPLFAARALLDRSPARALQTAVLAVAVLIQVVWFLQPAPKVDTTFDAAILSYIFFKNHLLLPWLGIRDEVRVAAILVNAIQAGNVLYWVVASAIAYVVAMAVLVKAWRPGTLTWMFAAALVVGILSYANARGGSVMAIAASNRYSYVPHILFALVFLGLAGQKRGVPRWVGRIAVIWMLAIGFVEFEAGAAGFDRGPAWTGEVAQWRQDPGYVLRAWPDGWVFDPNARTPR